MVEASDTQDP